MLTPQTPRRTASLFLAVLTACGPSFSGKWTGSLATATNCVAGSGTDAGTLSTEEVRPVTWIVVEQDSFVHVVTSGACGRLSGAWAPSVHLNEKTCDRESGRTNPIFRKGTLELSGNLLRIQDFESAYEQAALRCVERSSGILGREP